MNNFELFQQYPNYVVVVVNMEKPVEKRCLSSMQGSLLKLQTLTLGKLELAFTPDKNGPEDPFLDNVDIR